MRRRVYIAVLLLGLGGLGAFLGVEAQERSWPDPIIPPIPSDGTTTPWAPTSPNGSSIIPVTAVQESEVSPKPVAPMPPQGPEPGMFPANVVPAQALADGQTHSAENAPPPMFPEQKPPPAPASSAPDAGGPMLSPGDVAKPSKNTAPPEIPPAVVRTPAEPVVPPVRPEPRPKIFEQPIPPLPQTPAVQPYAAAPPEVRVPVAVPIRRSHVKGPDTAAVVTRKVIVPETVPPTAMPAALLTLEKRGSAELQLRRPARFEIIVRNVGSVPATQVRIEDTLPEHVRFLGGTPDPVLEAGRVIWNLPVVAPGQEQKVYLEVQPTMPGDLATQTSVSHTVESRMQVRPAMMSLNVRTPGRGAVGQPIVFEVQLANNSDEPVKTMILSAQMSQGLIHQTGRNIESDPFDLPPRSTKAVALTTTALQPGRQTIEVSIVSQGRQEALARAEVFVGENALVVHVPATSRLLPGRISELPIEIGNFDGRPARNLIVTSKLPKGLEFEGASDKGSHRGGTVQWAIDYLAPGQSRVLQVRVRARAAGDFAHIVSVKAADGLKAQTEGRVIIDGASQLSLTTAVRDNPLELGKETVFEIRLGNEGGAPESDVQMVALLPDGMAPRFIEGLGYHLRPGNQLVFDRISRLEPRSVKIVRIGVLATMPGDRRLRVQVSSPQMRTPLMREERTLVYADR